MQKGFVQSQDGMQTHSLMLAKQEKNKSGYEALALIHIQHSPELLLLIQ